MNMPLQLCEERDAKGLYKLARAGKIKGSFKKYLICSFGLMIFVASKKEKVQKNQIWREIWNKHFCLDGRSQFDFLFFD